MVLPGTPQTGVMGPRLPERAAARPVLLDPGRAQEVTSSERKTMPVAGFGWK